MESRTPLPFFHSNKSLARTLGLEEQEPQTAKVRLWFNGLSLQETPEIFLSLCICPSLHIHLRRIFKKLGREKRGCGYLS
jgi:hypothetical protein